jgi:hypothetical protein
VKSVFSEVSAVGLAGWQPAEWLSADCQLLAEPAGPAKCLAGCVWMVLAGLGQAQSTQSVGAGLGLGLEKTFGYTLYRKFFCTGGASWQLTQAQKGPVNTLSDPADRVGWAALLDTKFFSCGYCSMLVI